MLSLPRLLTLCHACAALTPRCIKTATAPRHKMLRLPQNCKMHKHKVLCLPRENDTVTLTRFQSIAAATQHAIIIATMSQNATKTLCLRRNPTPAHHFVAFCDRRPTARHNAILPTQTDGSERQRSQEPPSANTGQPPRPPIINGNPSLRKTNKQTNKQTNNQPTKQTSKQTANQTNKQTNKQPANQTNKQTNKQTK